MKNQRSINTVVFIILSVTAITIMLLGFFLLSVMIFGFMERGALYLLLILATTVIPSAIIYGIAVRQLKKRGMVNIKKNLF